MMTPRNELPQKDSWYNRYGVYLMIVLIFVVVLAVAVWAGGYDSSLCLRPVC